MTKGRKKINPILKRERISIRLPLWLIQWLQKNGNQGRLIEKLLKEKFNLKEPDQ